MEPNNIEQCYKGDVPVRIKKYDDLEPACENNSPECYEKNYPDYVHILKKGSILYTGQTIKNEINAHKIYENDEKIKKKIEDIFKYVGMSQIELEKQQYKHYVTYFSSNINTAIGYGECAINPSQGLVNKFRVKEDIPLLKNGIYLEAKEVADCICEYPFVNIKNKHPKIVGNYVSYGFNQYNNSNDDEMSICDPWKYLEYMGSMVYDNKRIQQPFKIVYDIDYGNMQKGANINYYKKYLKYKQKYVNLHKKY